MNDSVNVCDQPLVREPKRTEIACAVWTLIFVVIQSRGRINNYLRRLYYAFILSSQRAIRGEAEVAPCCNASFARVGQVQKTSKVCNFCDYKLIHQKEERIVCDRKVKELQKLEGEES